MGAIMLGILMFGGMIIFGSLFLIFWMIDKTSHETMIGRASYLFNKNYTINMPKHCNKIRLILIAMYKIVYLAMFCGIVGAGIGMTGLFIEYREHPEMVPHKPIHSP